MGPSQGAGNDRVESAVVGKVPTFTGAENIDGFLRSFEIWAEDRNVAPRYMFSALRGALKDDARTFEYNVTYVGAPTYEQLKEALLANYGETSKMHYHELQQLRRGTKSIADYNAEFEKLATKAKRYLPSAF